MSDGDDDGELMSAEILDTIGQSGIAGRRYVLDVFRLSSGNFKLVEACDHCFSAVLTPAELRHLGEELIAISKTR